MHEIIRSINKYGCGDLSPGRALPLTLPSAVNMSFSRTKSKAVRQCWAELHTRSRALANVDEVDNFPIHINGIAAVAGSLQCDGAPK